MVCHSDLKFILGVFSLKDGDKKKMKIEKNELK